MKWVLKAVIQKAISVLPNPERANYFFQRRALKSFPLPRREFVWRVEHALNHSKAIQAHFHGLAGLRGYEFGAGWDMIIPLTYYALGIDDQTVVDIRPNLRLELVNDTITRLNGYREELESTYKVKMRPLDSRPLTGSADLRERFGINYCAPCDARNTKLPADSIDFITSTYTLEHIPRTDIILILRECHRILKPAGIVSSLIDMQDHYALCDNSISVYNYLQFPEWLWTMVNCSLHYQNRLRYSDYLDIAKQDGFSTVEEWIDQPTESDLKALHALKLDPRFSGYSQSSLAAKRLGLVMMRTPAFVSSPMTVAEEAPSPVAPG
jgi:SAM-dependent methyltransferase